jgi:hypothetical protein
MPREMRLYWHKIFFDKTPKRLIIDLIIKRFWVKKGKILRGKNTLPLQKYFVRVVMLKEYFKHQRKEIYTS